MKKKFGFWAIFTLAAITAIASVPLMQTIPTAYKSAPPAFVASSGDNSDAISHPVLDESTGRTREGALDVFDSLMYIETFTATCPYTSADLAVGDFWDPSTWEPYGGAGESWWCSDERLANVCPGLPGGYNNHWLQYLITPTIDLTGTTAPVLNYLAYWRSEAPGGEPVGYDGWDGWNMWISEDNGATWDTITPVSPAYTSASSYSFGDEWNFGVGIPAYDDTSAGWTQISASLAPYIGQNDIKIRFAFCSDPAFSTTDQAAGAACDRWGLRLDSIRVSDGSTVIHSNNGEAGAYTTATGPASPDTWSYVTDAADSVGHSGPNHWVAAVAPNISRGIYSCNVILPAGYQQLKLAYRVWADTPDFEGDGDGALDDYYTLNVSTNEGATWTQVGYDYANTVDGANSLTGWVRRPVALGTTSGAGYAIPILFQRTVAATAETLLFAIELVTDGNDDGGAGGTGVHVDDLEFIAVRAQDRDLSTNNIIVPLPNTVGISKQWTVRVSNEGLLPVSPVRYKLKYFRPDGTERPANPATDSTVVISGALNYQDDTLSTRIWSPDTVGAWRIRTIANLTGELDRTNDSAFTPINQTQNDDSTLSIVVRPAGTYELGYGRRSVANAYLNPRYYHVTPVADGVPAADADTSEIYQVRVMWRYDAELGSIGGRVRIDFYSEGVDTFHTGTLLNSFTTFVDTLETIGEGGFIKWWEYTLPCPVTVNGNFWWSMTQLDTFVIDGADQAAPLPLGISPAGVLPDGHNYFGEPGVAGGGDLTQSGGRILANAMTRAATALGNPTNVVISRGAALSPNVNLSWPAVAGACSYNVYRSTNFGAPVFLANTTTATYTDVGAVGAAKNYYVVRAVK